MSVGIYMPAFNSEKYIKESIDSLKSQTYKDWELVILDDNSEDNTLKVAQKEAEGDPRIHVHHKDSHEGLIGKLKNQAISLFSRDHEFICHVGSDDKIISDCLSIFTNYMNKNKNIGVCCGNFTCFNNEGREWTLPHVANSGEYDPNTLLRYMCLFPFRFYRKSIVDKVGGYSNELSSAVDYDLALKVDEITEIHRIKNPVSYLYRQHSEQVSTKSRTKQDLNAKTALTSALKRRGIDGTVTNDAPPFKIEYKQNASAGAHFIWGKNG